MKYKKSVFRSLSMVTQLGLCVIVPTFLCVFAGNYIDSRFGTKTILFLLLLGVLGGARGAYMMAQQMLKAEEKEDLKEREAAREEVLKNPISETVKPKQPSRVRRTVDVTAIKTDKEDADDEGN